MLKNNVDHPVSIFFVEAEQLWSLTFKLQKIGISFLDLMEEEGHIPIHKTPYFSILQSGYLSVPENKLSAFLEIVEFENKKETSNKIRVYKMEEMINTFGEKENAYRPLIVLDEKNILFSTTFFFQKLQKAEQFLNENERQEISDYNFLENIHLEKQDDKNATGYYISVAHMINSEFLALRDTGFFQLSMQEEKERTILKIAFTNIRDIIKSYSTPYDYVFGLLQQDGTKQSVLEEYYVPYQEKWFVHYAMDTEIVEIYEKSKDGKLLPLSGTRFFKTQPESDLERQIAYDFGFIEKRREIVLK